MQLKIGKTYLDGNGQPVKIVGLATDTATGDFPAFPFVGQSPYSIFHSYYRADGVSILEATFGTLFADTSLITEQETVQ